MGTILKPWLHTWRSIWRSFIVTRMYLVNSAPVCLQRWPWKPLKSSLLRTNRSARRVTLLRRIICWLQSVLTLMKMNCISRKTLCNILSKILSRTLGGVISWTTFLTISASLATSWMQVPDSQNARWRILKKHMDKPIVMKSPFWFCKRQSKRRNFSMKIWMYLPQNKP